MSRSGRTPITQRAFQGIAAGIGLVSESISAHKSKKQSQTSEPSLEDTPSRETPSGGEESPIDENETQEHGVSETSGLEEQWALDEAQEELLEEQGPSTSPPKYAEMEDEVALATHFANSHPSPPPYTRDENIAPPRLSAPVVLPQRRPKNRDRGFIRAYAPALADCGIDQETFIDFLNTAEKACAATPWLRAINLASIGTMWLPSVTGIAVSIAIQKATDAAMAVDGRRKSNSFFDKMNKEFFQPRGLFCLVMTWNPELPNAPSTAIDLNTLISQAAGSNTGKMGRLQHRFKSSDGKAYGNIFPEVAPLVFPSIDRLASDPDAEKVSKMKKKSQFVSGYMDKRAQAKFMAENPDSHLNQGPKPTFTSRYADPNHPASSGDPLALITGGNVTREKLRGLKGRRSRGLGGRRSYLYQEQEDSSGGPSSAPHAPYGRSFGLRDAVAMAKDARNPQTSAGSSGSAQIFERQRIRGSRGGQKERIGLLTPVTKLLKKEVMYLAIVNMPSEDEMSRAYEAVRQMD